jgi:hypothetical protein
LGRLKLLQTSTRANQFEGIWWKARFFDGDHSWARRNLVKGTDGKCELERHPDFERIDIGPFISNTDLPTSPFDRVVFKADEQHPRVLTQLKEAYDFRRLLEEAQSQREPEIAPHIMFRNLHSENDAAAIGFLHECGPLFREDMTRDPLVWIDLNDFWRKHARFVAITDLYQNFHNFELLRESVLYIVHNIDSLNVAGPATIGEIPGGGSRIPFLRLVTLSEPYVYRMLDQDGDPMWNHESFQNLARELIHSELLLQTNEGIRSGWELVDGGNAPNFRPTRVVTSLWAAIWEMFGLDMWRGFGWRSCRICSKYFYPLQVNSECCTPKHQALWSKRRYAQMHRKSGKLDKR